MSLPEGFIEAQNYPPCIHQIVGAHPRCRAKKAVWCKLLSLPITASYCHACEKRENKSSDTQADSVQL